MTRAPRLAFACLAFLLVLSAIATAPIAADGGGPPAATTTLPAAARWPRSLLTSPAVWDTVNALENRRAWVDAESLGVVLAAELARAPQVDSLAYSQAVQVIAFGRLHRRLFN